MTYLTRKIEVLILFLLLQMTSSAIAVEPAAEKPLPADVAKVVEAREAEIAKAKAVFDAAVGKSTVDAQKKLNEIMKTKTKAGDLEGAMAVKGLVDKWNGEAPDLLGINPVGPAEAIIGKWALLYWNGTRAEVEIKAEKDSLFMIRTQGYGSGVSYKLVYNELTKYFFGAGFDKGKTEYYTVINGIFTFKHCLVGTAMENTKYSGTGTRP